MFCQKNHSGCVRGKATVLILVVILAIAAGAYLRFMRNEHQQHTVHNTSSMQMTVLQTPREIGTFQLEYFQHPNYDKQSLLGKWTMMFFGFSNCPKLCPTTMSELNKVYSQLQQQHIQQLPQVVLVSVDPERDTAQIIADYAKGFNPTFIGVRGDEAQISALTKQLGVAYFKTPEPNNMANHSGMSDHQHYSINHSGTIILFNPEGKIAGFFSMPHQAANIASEFVKVSQQGVSEQHS